MKKLATAYLLWLFLGWAGIHHFYLRRYHQGVLWLTSFAGFFGIGLLRDLLRLPKYVRDANDDQGIIQELELQNPSNDSDYNDQRELGTLPRDSCGPKILSNWHRVWAQVLFAVFYRGLMHYAFPWDSSIINIAPLIIPLGTAFGTYMVSTVGPQKSPFYLSLIGAYIGELLLGEYHLLLQYSNPILVAGVSMIFLTCGWKWRIEKEQLSWRKLLLIFLLFYCLFVSLCSSYVYFNAILKTEDGKTIKLREAFEKSPLWEQNKIAFFELLGAAYGSWETDGLRGVWNKLKDVVDRDGERHAYDVLGLEQRTEFEEVRKKYKQLMWKWHPDHNKGEQIAMDEFMKYQSAYKVLERIHKRKKETHSEL